MKKILIINTFGIGDVLFSTPLISNIKAQMPGVFVGYIGNCRTAAMLKNNPKINKVFVYERDEFYDVYKRSKAAFFKKWAGFAKDLKNEHFDCVLDLSLQESFGFLTGLIGIKQRIGFNYKGRGRFLTKAIPFKGYENKHVTEHYLELLKEIGVNVQTNGLEFAVAEEERRWAHELLQRNGLLNKKPVVALIPGGGASWGKDAAFKRWPAGSYAKLTDKIIEKFSAAIILMGDKKEKEICEELKGKLEFLRPFGPQDDPSGIKKNVPTGSVLDLCGSTTLGQMAALLSNCTLAIVNDGGPLHVAAAVGAKTVSIFGPVDEAVYGPYPADGHKVVTSNVACRPCYRQFRRASCEHISCLNNITVEDVFRKVEEVLLTFV